MIKSLIAKLPGKFGYKLVKITDQNGTVLRNPSMSKTKSYTTQLAQDPLNADLHFQFGIYCSQLGNYTLAYAELKTAAFLGMNSEEIMRHLNNITQSISKTEDMNHNQYFRFDTLASVIRPLVNQSNISVLDVGGGQGRLAQFIPGASYCLAEPTVNGISGTDLPFKNKSFDYVVACHVLEHIPPDDRELFLDQLLSKAKFGLILLNPFYQEKINVDERLKLFIEITQADWAKEHLECSLPKLEMIQDYAQKRGLTYDIKPNGTLTTTMALEFMNYFASKAGCLEELRKLNRFFNVQLSDIMDSKVYPNAFLIILTNKTE